MKTFLPLTFVAFVASFPLIAAADMLGVPVLANIGLMPVLMSYLAMGFALIIQDSYGNRRRIGKKPTPRRTSSTSLPQYCLEPGCQGRAI